MRVECQVLNVSKDVTLLWGTRHPRAQLLYHAGSMYTDQPLHPKLTARLPLASQLMVCGYDASCWNILVKQVGLPPPVSSQRGPLSSVPSVPKPLVCG